MWHTLYEMILTLIYFSSYSRRPFRRGTTFLCPEILLLPECLFVPTNPPNFSVQGIQNKSVFLQISI